MLAMTSTSSLSSGGGAGAGAGAGEMDAPEWLRSFQLLEGTIEEGSNELNDAAAKGLGNRQKRTIGKKVAESRDQIARLERSLASMERNPMKFKIGEGEIARRKGLLATARSANDRLDNELNGGGSARGALMGNSRRQTSLADESEESKQQSNVMLLAQQRAALSSQDSKLDGILDGVSRLKVMSSDINAELDLHAGLLSELDSAVDSTDARLQRNTKRIEIVQEKSGGCCGLIIMIILFALIIILLVTNWGCHVFKPSKC